MNTTLLNPFSVSLKKHPYMEMREAPIYANSDYKIYSYSRNHFVHTFKNIVIAERGKADKPLIEGLINDIKPTNESDLYHNYERPKKAILDGIAAAQKLHFEIK